MANPAYRAAGVGNNAYAFSGTVTTTFNGPNASVGDTIGVWVSTVNAGGGTTTVTCGGVPMTQHGSTITWIAGNPNYYLQLFKITVDGTTVTAGVKSIVASNTAAAGIAANGFAYSDVASLGSIVFVTGTGSALSQTISSAADGRMISQIFVSRSTVTPNYTAGQNSRWNATSSNWFGYSASHQVGDAAGNTSVTFSASSSASAGWVGAAVELIGAAGATVTPSGTTATATGGAPAVDFGPLTVSPPGATTTATPGSPAVATSGSTTIAPPAAGISTSGGAPLLRPFLPQAAARAKLEAGTQDVGIGFFGDSCTEGWGDLSFSGGFPPIVGKIVGKRYDYNVYYAKWNGAISGWATPSLIQAAPVRGASAPKLYIWNAGVSTTGLSNQNTYLSQGILDKIAQTDFYVIGTGYNDVTNTGQIAAFQPNYATYVANFRAAVTAAGYPTKPLIVTDENPLGNNNDTIYLPAFQSIAQWLVGQNLPTSPALNVSTTVEDVSFLDTRQAWVNRDADYIASGVHPNLAGYTAMAGFIAQALFDIVTAMPDNADLTATGGAPSLGLTESPGGAAIVTSPGTPGVVAPVSEQPGGASVAVAPGSPGVVAPADLQPGAATITTTPGAPGSASPVIVTPGTAAGTAIPGTPAVAATSGTAVKPGSDQITTGSGTPGVTAPVKVTPGAAPTTATVGAPTVITGPTQAEPRVAIMTVFNSPVGASMTVEVLPLTKVFDVGDPCKPTVTIKDAVTGQLADPEHLFFELQRPDGTKVTYRYGVDDEIVRDSVGRFHFYLVLAQAGNWVGRFSTVGDLAGAELFEISVRDSVFGAIPVVS